MGGQAGEADRGWRGGGFGAPGGEARGVDGLNPRCRFAGAHVHLRTEERRLSARLQHGEHGRKGKVGKCTHHWVTGDVEVTPAAIGVIAHGSSPSEFALDPTPNCVVVVSGGRKVCVWWIRKPMRFLKAHERGLVGVI
jgi:hypothetical protein